MKVLVVDDEADTRMLVRLLLEADRPREVVAEAARAAEALKAAALSDRTSSSSTTSSTVR